MTHKQQLNDTQLSKKLSWLLRHGAQKEGIHIGNDGYVLVNAILSHPNYASLYTLETLKRLVENDEKQRYSLRLCQKTEQFAIRANQGHSMTLVDAGNCLVQIKNADEIPMAVHGTYYRHWPKILCEGIRCMGRNQIHFAATDKVSKGTSGFRHNCQVLIYLDVAEAMNRGISFYRSENNVILSAGKDGSITKEFFKKVVDRNTSALIEY